MAMSREGATYKYEDKKKHEAYLEWYQERNMVEVSRRLGIPEATLNVWKKKFDWDSRAIAMDEQEKARLDELVTEQTAQFKAKMLNRIESSLDKLWEELGAEGIAGMVDRPSDIDKLTKLALLLRGDKGVASDEERGKAVSDAASKILKEVRKKSGGNKAK